MKKHNSFKMKLILSTWMLIVTLGMFAQNVYVFGFDLYILYVSQIKWRISCLAGKEKGMMRICDLSHF